VFATRRAAPAISEADEYSRAVRQLGPIGTLHLAHVTKPGAGTKANEDKPFGSVFWFNQMRSCWFVKRAQATSEDDSRVVLGLYHRKNNFGGLRPPVGLELAFGPATTSVVSRDLAEVGELAAGVPTWRRILPVLKGGLRTVAELVEETGALEDTIEKALKRTKRKDKAPMFVCVTNTPDGVHRWGLSERRVS